MNTVYDSLAVRATERASVVEWIDEHLIIGPLPFDDEVTRKSNTNERPTQLMSDIQPDN